MEMEGPDGNVKERQMKTPSPLTSRSPLYAESLPAILYTPIKELWCKILMKGIFESYNIRKQNYSHTKNQITINNMKIAIIFWDVMWFPVPLPLVTLSLFFLWALIIHYLDSSLASLPFVWFGRSFTFPYSPFSSPSVGGVGVVFSFLFPSCTNTTTRNDQRTRPTIHIKDYHSRICVYLHSWWFLVQQMNTKPQGHQEPPNESLM